MTNRKHGLSAVPGTGPYQVRWKNLKFCELKPDEQIDP